MTYQATVLADSPTAYWRLNEASGTTAADSSGNGHDGTFTNAPTLGVASIMPGDSSTCIACSHTATGPTSDSSPNPGSGFFVAATSALNIGSSEDFALECWIASTNTTDNGVFMSEHLATPNWLGKFPNTLFDPNASLTGTLGLGTTLKHCVFRRVSGTVSLYVNTVADSATATGDVTTYTCATAGFDFGYFWAVGGFGYGGKLQNVAFYKGAAATALTPTRITAHYAAGTAGASMAVSQNLGDMVMLSGTSVSVTAALPTGGSGSYTYAWHLGGTAGFTPGGGTLVSGQTTRTATFSSLTANLMKYAKCVISDGTTTVTSYQRPIYLGSLAPLRVGFIGDSTSVVAFTGNDGFSPSVTLAASDVTKSVLSTYLGNRKITAVNAAVSGSTSAGWVSGSTNMNAALAAFTAAGMTTGDFVSVRLLVNDAQGAVSPSTATTNMTSALGALTGAGYKVILAYPTYREPGPFVEDSGATTFDETYATNHAALLSVVDGLINGTTIFAGDKQSAFNSATRPTEMFRSSALYRGAIHPAVGGVLEQGTNDALALLTAMGTIGSTGTFPTAAQVLTGITFGPTNNLTGTVVQPTAAQVLSGISFGPSGSPLTGTVVVPTTGQVASGVTFGAASALTGTLASPTAAQVLLGVTFGAAGALTGTVVQPTAGQVQSDVHFGPGSGLTGTYTGPPAPPPPPPPTGTPATLVRAIVNSAAALAPNVQVEVQFVSGSSLMTGPAFSLGFFEDGVSRFTLPAASPVSVGSSSVLAVVVEITIPDDAPFIADGDRLALIITGTTGDSQKLDAVGVAA